MIKIHNVYKHYKGNYYIVLGVCRDANNPQEVIVTYHSLNKDFNNEYITWARPLKEFTSKLDDGTDRFTLLEFNYYINSIIHDTDHSCLIAYNKQLILDFGEYEGRHIADTPEKYRYDLYLLEGTFLYKNYFKIYNWLSKDLLAKHGKLFHLIK